MSGEGIAGLVIGGDTPAAAAAGDAENDIGAGMVGDAMGDAVAAAADSRIESLDFGGNDYADSTKWS